MPNLENAPTEEQISADHSEAKRIDLAQDFHALAEQQMQAGHAMASERSSEMANLVEQRGSGISEGNIDEARASVAEALEKAESPQEAA